MDEDGASEPDDEEIDDYLNELEESDDD